MNTDLSFFQPPSLNTEVMSPTSNAASKLCIICVKLNVVLKGIKGQKSFHEHI